MVTFKESGLQFNFPENWNIIKFDDHRFYHYVHGIGLKGVDFIALKPNGQLVLIEVKNYADRFPQDGIKPAVALLKDPIPYGKKIAQKFEDSFQLITVIHKYHLRQFWFKQMALPLFPLLPPFIRNKFDWAFWLKAYQKTTEQPQLILWMELGTEVSTSDRQQLHQSMSDLFQTYFKAQQWSVDIMDQHTKSNLITIQS